MKRMLACLFTLLLLAGCGSGGAEPPEAQEEKPAAPEVSEPAEPAAPAGLSLYLEREVYDPSLTRYTCFLENRTDKTVEFGEDYSIQFFSEDEWVDLRPRPSCGTDAIGYRLSSGETMALDCTLERYENAPEPGRYRLVKQVEGHTLYAEFSLGESPYTAETPYGFLPLEDLPADYGADTAEDSYVVFTGEGMEHPEAVEDFLRKVELQARCQLRVVQDYGEGSPMVTDAIYEYGRFRWRLWSGGGITERYFPYIVSRGQDVYLSDGADWASSEKYAAQRTLLLPEGVTPEMSAAVETMTEARLAGNAVPLQVFFSDGAWCASLLDASAPTEFTVGYRFPEGNGAAGFHKSFDLQDWDGLETSVKKMEWQEDGTLRLTCGTSDGGTSTLSFDARTKVLADLGIPDPALEDLSDPAGHA